MPNGRPYESPLNRLADALPTFLLQMQDMKMRQEAQEALNEYRWGALAEQKQARVALEAVRREMGYYKPPEPPEFKLLRDSISSQYRTLSDPDATVMLDDDVIIKRWKKLRGDEADYFGKTGKHISLSTPISVEGALSRVEAAKPPPAAAPPVAPRVAPPGIEEGAAGLRGAIKGTVVKAAKGLVKGPRIGAKPLGLGFPGVRVGGETEALAAPAVEAPTIPEGARSVLTDKGWIYTLDEKTWILVETGEPITGQ